MRSKKRRAQRYLIRALGSQKFLYGVVILLVVEALWIAVSFRFPMVYDEDWHFGLIKAFSEYWWPVIYNQPESLDHLRNLNGGSTLYHFVASFPYRFIDLFTDSMAIQIMAQRILSIGMVAGGIVLFAQLFREMRIKPAIVNVGLLFFVLVPIVPFVAAHINYDNMLFLLMALFLLVGVRIIRQEKTSWHLYANFILVGMIACLVKFSFLPVFFVGLIYILVATWKREGIREFFIRQKLSLSSTNRVTVVAILLPLGLISIVFSSIYIANTFIYGTPKPSCIQQLSRERCISNPVVAYYENIRATKDQREAVPPSSFTLEWIKIMASNTNISAANVKEPSNKLEVRKPLDLIAIITFAATFIGIGVLVYAWRSMPKSAGFYFLIAIAMFYVAVLFYTNLKGYYNNNHFSAIQPRYLIIILPVLLVFITYAVNYILQKKETLKLGILITVIALYTVSGSGVLTHMVLSQSNWYWPDEDLININHTIQQAVDPVVIEEL